MIPAQINICILTIALLFVSILLYAHYLQLYPSLIIQDTKNNVHFHDNIKNYVINNNNNNTRRFNQEDPSIPQLPVKYPQPFKIPVSNEKIYCLPIDKDLSPLNVTSQNGKSS